MLGYLLGLLLVLALFSPVILSESFAENKISIEFDKSQYQTEDLLELSGTISDFGMPIIALSVFDPDGKILSANNLEISPEGEFSKSISLDSPFYEKSGDYKVKLDYGKLTEEYFFLIEGQNNTSDSEIILESDSSEINSITEIISVSSDKEKYTDGEFITISGVVSNLESPTVLIGVFDPIGTPVGFYFGEINSDLEFSTNFLVKSGVNFRLDGIYSIRANYVDSEKTSSFEFQEKLLNLSELDEEIVLNEDNQTEKELEELLDEIISDIEKLEEQQKNSVPVQEIISETNPKKQLENESEPTKNEKNSIIKNNDQKQVTQVKNNSKQQEPPTVDTSKNSNPQIKEKKENNLTVEDIELGKLLNQINLDCDSSTFTDTISYYDGMGPALYRLCKFDSSLNFFNESLLNDPNNIEILVNKGSALGKLGYHTEAILHYDQAITLDPTFLPAKNNKANALANLGNFDEAILLYQEILEVNPNYSTARTNLEIILPLTIPQTNEVIDFSGIPTAENIDFEKPTSLSSNQTQISDIEIDEPSNFFEEVGIAFSSLSSLFNFLE